MKKNLSITIICFLCSIFFTFGQTAIERPSEIIEASPNAYSLGIFGSIPNGHYTGTPNISIPLYEINLDGKTIPITLSYHSSGIRVSQEASWVGLGWALGAGGMITRNINGGIDFGQSEPVMEGYYYNTKLYDYLKKSSDYMQLLDKESIKDVFLNELHKDTEPDSYTYNFGGYSGVMYTGNLADEGNSFTYANGILRQPKEYLKVKYNIGEDSWYIIDGFGYKYYFNSKEKTISKTRSIQNNIKYIEQNYINTYYPDRKKLLDGSGSTMGEHTSSWLLDSIVSPKRNKIVFIYESENIESIISLSENYLNYAPYSIGTGSTKETTFTYGLSHSYIKQAVLKKIQFDGGDITFKTSDRDDLIKHITYVGDLTKPQKLEEIVINDISSNEIKKIKFDYKYSGNRSNPYSCRLYLNQVNINQQIYQFDYNNIEGLPLKHSLRTDHWGYYTDDNTTDYLYEKYYFLTIPPIDDFVYNLHFIGGRYKSANEKLMKYGTLQSIQYPTKGKTYFDYESHVSSPIYSYSKQKTIGKINYEASDDPYEPNLDYREYLYSDEFILHGAYTITAKISPAGFIDDDGFLNGMTYEFGLEKFNGLIFEPYLLKYNGAERQWIPRVYKHSNDRDEFKYNSPTEGTYRLVARKDNIFNDYGSLSVSLSIMEMSDNKGGGLRVKEIKNVTDGIEESKSYHYSGGELMVAPIYHRYNEDYRYQTASSNSFTPLTYSAQGSPIGYDMVKEKYIGYTEYEFHNESDDLLNSENDYIPGIPTVPDLMNGLTYKTTHSDTNGNMKATKENEYFKLSHDKLSHKIIGYKKNPNWQSLKEPVGASVVWEEFFRRKLFREWFQYYEQPCEIILLKSETDSTYFDNAATAIKKRYEYDLNYLTTKEIITTNSTQEEVKTLLKYPFEKSDIISLKMIENNLVEIPVEEIIIKNNNVVSANRVEYYDTLNILTPQKYYRLDTSFPLNIHNYENSYRMDMKINRYNTKGKILQIEDKSNSLVVYLWSYSGQYPIAEIKNASYNEVKSALGWDDTYINSLSVKIVPSDSDMTKINSLRALLPKAMVTTYTYKPLIGMETMIDPRGIKLTYEYDDFGRLKQIKDHDGKLLESYDYNYRNK